jgi:hypothetical protein
MGRFAHDREEFWDAPIKGEGCPSRWAFNLIVAAAFILFKICFRYKVEGREHLDLGEGKAADAEVFCLERVSMLGCDAHHLTDEGVTIAGGYRVDLRSDLVIGNRFLQELSRIVLHESLPIRQVGTDSVHRVAFSPDDDTRAANSSSHDVDPFAVTRFPIP